MTGAFSGARGRVGIIDWLMLALAVLSIGLLSYALLAEIPAERRYTIFLIDTAICGIFAVEFVARWVGDDRPRTFPLRRWYEILGMIPVAHPALRSFRLLRLVRIVVLLSRFGRATDRALGEEFTYRLTRRFRGAVADALGDAVTLRMMDEIEDVVAQGAFTRNLATTLEENQPRIHGIIVEKVRRDRTVGRLRYLPFFNDLVDTMAVVAQRVLIEFLRDPRADGLGKAVLQENLAQLRTAIQQREDAERPSGARSAPTRPRTSAADRG